MAVEVIDAVLTGIETMDGDAGWLGVDLILGNRPDCRDDRVLEVNPRLTTSLVGLSALFASSLVAAMIEAVTGGRPAIQRAAGPAVTASFDLPTA